MKQSGRSTLLLLLAGLGLLVVAVTVVIVTLKQVKPSDSRTEIASSNFELADGVTLPKDLPSNALILSDLTITEATSKDGIIIIVQRSTKSGNELRNLIKSAAIASGWSLRQEDATSLTFGTSVQTAIVVIAEQTGDGGTTGGTTTVTTTITTGGGGSTGLTSGTPAPSSSGGSTGGGTIGTGGTSTSTPTPSTSASSTPRPTSTTTTSPDGTIITTE